MSHNRRWRAMGDSNPRPQASEACALSTELIARSGNSKLLHDLLHVFPKGLLEIRVPEKRRWMISYHDFELSVTVKFPAQAPEARLGFKNRLRRRVSEAHNDLWIYRSQLLEQERLPLRHLVRGRGPVVGRPRLHNVRDVHVLPL